jgi:hypothetical protein
MVDDIDRLTEEEVYLVFLGDKSTRRFSESYFSFNLPAPSCGNLGDPAKVLTTVLRTVFRGWYPRFDCSGGLNPDFLTLSSNTPGFYS